MKIRASIIKFLILLFMPFFLWQCSEDPLVDDLSNSNLSIDTLVVSEIFGENYMVAPNIGSNERLYLGTKHGIDAPLSFIRILTPIPHSYDSSFVIDSLRFILYTKDSSLSTNSIPNLFYFPDSQFDENNSTYLDYGDFSLSDWLDLGQPSVRSVTDTTDTSSFFTHTELVWNIDSLKQSLTDTLDSILVRSFAVQLANNDSNYIEIFSEEASQGQRDPKILMYYRQNITSADSTVIDTNFVTIYSNGDLSIIDPSSAEPSYNQLGLSNGLGLRSVLNISFNAGSLPENSIIRSGNLILNADTSLTPAVYNIIIDPLNSDSSVVDSITIYDTDPYDAIGYPYRVSTDAENWVYTFQIKNILQNISLGNETNIGFKLVANEKNDPFESAWFSIQSEPKPRLEIIYVAN
tara:strand:- start:18 stop:1238 length:1221 start_codon:yes stop_codon:yes gene_type:complete